MAQLAYNLDHFAQGNKAEKNKKPQVKVVKQAKNKQQKQVLTMFRNMTLVMMVVGLLFGVLYTQAKITELQNEIVRTEKMLKEKQGDAAYLNNELQSLSNLRHIEERAQELGLQKVDGNRIAYIRVNPEDTIEVKENGLERLMEKAQNGLLSAWDYLNP